MKNLIVFFELTFFVGLILILTGQIDENTPVLGLIFGELSVSINEALAQNTTTGEFWTDLAASIITILVSAGILSTNLKRIAIADIKSKKLKKSLIQAGMYFNQNGKLVKRIEEAARIDLNGDNKIGDTGISVDDIPKEGFFPGIKRAGEELGTILTMKIETVNDAKDIEKKAELNETKEALKLVKAQAKIELKEKADEAVLSIVKEPGLASKLVSGVASAAKTSAKSTGLLFVNIGKGIGSLSIKFFNLFKKKEKVAKIQKAPKETKKDIKKQEKIQVQQPKVEAPVQVIPSGEMTPEQRRDMRLQRMKDAQKGIK
jgi:hypothetical protein